VIAAALEPLYRAYLRRLDEMAARLPAEALLRESTTRAADGGVALGPGGLPMIFDVADSRGGETFEVCGAAPDQPALRQARQGGIEVEAGPGNWEALPVACTLEEAGDADLLALADLFRAWALLASSGAFAAGAPAPWSGRLHGVRIELGGAGLVATLDLGTCPPRALEALVAALDGFGRDHARLTRVAIGLPPQA